LVREVAADVVRQLSGAAVTAFRLLAQGGQGDVVQVAAQRPTALRRSPLAREPLF
jgi:hypothetical protein